MLNISTQRVGGLRFIKIGRLTISYSVAQAYRPIGSGADERARRRFDRKVRAAAKVEKAFWRGMGVAQAFGDR